MLIQFTQADRLFQKQAQLAELNQKVAVFFWFSFFFSFCYNTVKQTSIQFRFSFFVLEVEFTTNYIYKCNQLINNNIGIIHIQFIFRYTLSYSIQYVQYIQTTIFTTLGVKKLFSKASLISSFELTNGKVVGLCINCLELILLLSWEQRYTI